MSTFRFVILGAAKIAAKFVDAVNRIDGCEVIAVASKSAERAKTFAETNNVPAWYDDYETMLEKEEADGAYIAVTPNDHYRLSMMCLKHQIPVMCEKAMFCSSEEAIEVFEEAKKQNTFIMEALWSKFQPANIMAKKWLQEGKIGTVEFAHASIGFVAPPGEDNRYRSPALGGGAAKDLLCYAYEITDWLLEQKELSHSVYATWSDGGVDLNDQVTIQYEKTLASLSCSFAARLDENLVISGSEGHIVIPRPHFGDAAYLYDNRNNLVEQLVDNDEDKNGFVYEIEEMIRCVREGILETPVCSHEATIKCARLFDEINATKKSL